MRVDITCGDGESRSNLALNSELGLLSVGRPEVGLVDKGHLKLGKWTTIGDIQPQRRLRKQGRGNASVASRWRDRAGDRALGEECLENVRSSELGVAGHSRNRDDIDRDLAVAGAASVTRVKAESSGHSADGIQVIHLTGRRRVPYRAIVRV